MAFKTTAPAASFWLSLTISKPLAEANRGLTSVVAAVDGSTILPSTFLSLSPRPPSTNASVTRSGVPFESVS